MTKPKTKGNASKGKDGKSKMTHPTPKTPEKRNYTSSELMSQSMSTKTDDHMKMDKYEMEMAYAGANVNQIRRPVGCPMARDRPCHCLLSGTSPRACPYRPADPKIILTAIKPPPGQYNTFNENRNYADNMQYLQSALTQIQQKPTAAAAKGTGHTQPATSQVGSNTSASVTSAVSSGANENLNQAKVDIVAQLEKYRTNVCQIRKHGNKTTAKNGQQATGLSNGQQRQQQQKEQAKKDGKDEKEGKKKK